MSREPVQIVEIRQPFCQNTFGTAPCTAVAAYPSTKCFNTRSTCQDPDNFNKGELSLFFSQGNIGDRNIRFSSDPGQDKAIYVLPFLVSVSTQPTKINLGTTEGNDLGLGVRSTNTIVFSDRPHNDRIVDPYLSDRSYNPVERGSFWTKWAARNVFRYNATVVVYDGYAGQALDEMVSRTQILTGFDGSDSLGRAVIETTDPLSLIEQRKAQAPEASPGELAADVLSTDLTFDVGGAVEDDYDASGTVRIGDELIQYSSRTTVDSIVRFTVSARGSDGTQAQDHSLEDGVQLCVRYTDTPVGDILSDLLVNRGGVPAEYISDSVTAETQRFLAAYRLTTVITEPVSVQTLIDELQEQCGFFIWWDERTSLINLKALRGVGEDPELVSDAANLLNLSISDRPDNRISQLWFYYGMRDFTGDLDNPANYVNVKIQANLASEGSDQYGEKSLRPIFSRWIRNASLAISTSSKIITRYSRVPRVAVFQMDAKDRQYWVGNNVRLSHYLDVNAFGERNEAYWTITSAEEVVPGHTVEYEAEDTTLYGFVAAIQAPGTPNYTPGNDPRYFGFIGDGNGLMSDGTPATRLG